MPQSEVLINYLTWADLQETRDSPLGKLLFNRLTEKSITIDSDISIEAANAVFEGGKEASLTAIKTIAYVVLCPSLPCQTKLHSLELLDVLISVDGIYSARFAKEQGLMALLEDFSVAPATKLTRFLPENENSKAAELASAAQKISSHWRALYSERSGTAKHPEIANSERVHLFRISDIPKGYAGGSSRGTRSGESAGRDRPVSIMSKSKPPFKESRLGMMVRREPTFGAPLRVRSSADTRARPAKRSDSSSHGGKGRAAVVSKDDPSLLVNRIAVAEKLSEKIRGLSPEDKTAEQIEQLRAEANSAVEILQTEANKAVDEDRMNDFTRVTRITEDLHLAIHLLSEMVKDTGEGVPVAEAAATDTKSAAGATQPWVTIERGDQPQSESMEWMGAHESWNNEGKTAPIDESSPMFQAVPDETQTVDILTKSQEDLWRDPWEAAETEAKLRSPTKIKEKKEREADRTADRTADLPPAHARASRSKKRNEKISATTNFGPDQEQAGHDENMNDIGKNSPEIRQRISRPESTFEFYTVKDRLEDPALRQGQNAVMEDASENRVKEANKVIELLRSDLQVEKEKNQSLLHELKQEKNESEVAREVQERLRKEFTLKMEIKEAERLDFERKYKLECAESKKLAESHSEAKKEMEHCKEMWMRENARASTLHITTKEKDEQICILERQLEEARQKLQRALTRLKQLEFILARDSEHHQPAAIQTEEVNNPPPEDAEVWQPRSREICTKPPEYNADSHKWDDEPRSAASPHHGNSVVRENQARFTTLLSKDAGLLYLEHQIIEIGLKMTMEGTTAVLRIFYGNLSIGPLDEFQVDFDFTDCLKSTRNSTTGSPPALAWKISPAPTCLLEGQQICQHLVVTVSAPYSGKVQACSRFLLPDATPRIVQFQIPLPITKFLTPLSLSPREFYARWKANSFFLNELSKTVQIQSALLSPLVRLTDILQLEGRLELLLGLDPNPNVFILAGRFPPPGRPELPLSVVLVRFELGRDSHAKRGHITVRSDTADLSAAVLHVLVDICGAYRDILAQNNNKIKA